MNVVSMETAIDIVNVISDLKPHKFLLYLEQHACYCRKMFRLIDEDGELHVETTCVLGPGVQDDKHTPEIETFANFVWDTAMYGENVFWLLLSGKAPTQLNEVEYEVPASEYGALAGEMIYGDTEGSGITAAGIAAGIEQVMSMNDAMETKE